MDGQSISVETAERYVGGFHPHCNCSFIPIINRREFIRAPWSDDETAWASGAPLSTEPVIIS
jgi:hypothetical protein